MTEIKQVFFNNNHIINAERSERLFKIETLFRNRREREGDGGDGGGGASSSIYMHLLGLIKINF